MRKNLDRLGGLVHSQRVLLALTQKGVAREDAYRLVQRNAMKVWAGGGDFLTLLKADTGRAQALERGRARRQFRSRFSLRPRRHDFRPRVRPRLIALTMFRHGPVSAAVGFPCPTRPLCRTLTQPTGRESWAVWYANRNWLKPSSAADRRFRRHVSIDCADPPVAAAVPGDDYLTAHGEIYSGRGDRLLDAGERHPRSKR